MRSGWSNTPLGELVVQSKESVKVLPNQTYKLLGVRWYGNGPFVREEVTSETSKATRLFPVQTGDFIYNRLFAWKGSFGLITQELNGCFVSSEFPLFRVRQDLLDAVFLNLIMCQPSKWAQIEIESTGSTSVSRNRWKEERFLEQEISLPPLEKQKQIVDFVSSIDNYIDALQQQVDSARTARNAVLHELLTAGGDDWTETTLDDLVQSGVVSLGRGNVISKKDMDADPGPYPVYSSAQNNDGRIGTYNKFMFDEELITWSVDGGGYVFYRPHHKFSVTNIGGYLRILDGSKFLYPFLAVVLQKLHGQHAFDWQNKAHPSVIRRLYNNIPLAPLTEQKRIVDVESSMAEVIHSTELAVVEAKALRSGLISELLSGEHEISGSYDSLPGAL